MCWAHQPATEMTGKRPISPEDVRLAEPASLDTILRKHQILLHETKKCINVKRIGTKPQQQELIVTRFPTSPTADVNEDGKG